MSDNDQGLRRGFNFFLLLGLIFFVGINVFVFGSILSSIHKEKQHVRTGTELSNLARSGVPPTISKAMNGCRMLSGSEKTECFAELAELSKVAEEAQSNDGSTWFRFGLLILIACYLSFSAIKAVLPSFRRSGDK